MGIGVTVAGGSVGVGSLGFVGMAVQAETISRVYANIKVRICVCRESFIRVIIH